VGARSRLVTLRLHVSALTDRQPRWQTTAIANAEYWIEHTGGVDPVPPNDFDEPDPPHRWDSSAAACAAGGLIMLASLVPDATTAQQFHDHAQRTIARLCEPEFVAHDQEWDGVLKHGIYHQARRLGVDESVMGGTTSSWRCSLGCWHRDDQPPL
jgi:unsaturated chondroitin disaccharide hydrolase